MTSKEIKKQNTVRLIGWVLLLFSWLLMLVLFISAIQCFDTGLCFN